ncbi:NmrA family NAD(P)-binding protein, partial [uncultured Acinetobacter sp.]
MQKNTPILVTGATGYVAGWIIERLLGQGFTVHATVRDPSQTQKLQHL